MFNCKSQKYVSDVIIRQIDRALWSYASAESLDRFCTSLLALLALLPHIRVPKGNCTLTLAFSISLATEITDHLDNPVIFWTCDLLRRNRKLKTHFFLLLLRWSSPSSQCLHFNFSRFLRIFHSNLHSCFFSSFSLPLPLIPTLPRGDSIHGIPSNAFGAVNPCAI